ncbi:hypothetical protein SAMN06272735_5011 [Streptomyces sp. TLI_55]|uniref:hypothetical protein n=1 Tax=Streptomyces sp. TLI_55 TaxID=1938861 RepID=UPI000BCFC2F9|nr:hypothetical protein [Streptomyces sp. TLI_55]SNX63209.1 hypothetical protein SAMN06272735_5011 [Streptomyces sp. TLI_55]
MSEVLFELQRAASGRGARGEVLMWVGEVGGLGAVRLAFPTEYSDYPPEYCEVAVSGDSFPLVTYLGLRYLRRPLLARGGLNVDWDPAELSRRVWWPGKKGRALRIQVKGRSYTYVQSGGKCAHELVRSGAGVRMKRSSWRNPRTIAGACVGEADALDIGVALVLEGVYTRNLSVGGALVSLPGRFVNRFNDL